MFNKLPHLSGPVDASGEPERWRKLYRALAWMVNDYIGISDGEVDFTKKDPRLGYAHEGYHNARIVMRENKPPVPDGMQQGIRCKCWAKERGINAGTRHEHYDEPPYSCARCGCKSYEPATAAAVPSPPAQEPRMTEQHLAECLARLEDTRRLMDQIQTDLRGAQEFRDAVFDLLEGTPFGAQADSTYDGLYGRLRAAITSALPPSPPVADSPTWLLIEQWREEATDADTARDSGDNIERDAGKSIRRCAKELEAALSAPSASAGAAQENTTTMEKPCR